MINIFVLNFSKYFIASSARLVLTAMRGHLDDDGYTQIPQLTSMNPIDVDTKFDLVPDSATGTRRAVMIGINYVGQLN